MSESLNVFLSTLNDVLWHESVLFTLLGLGIVFTIWSKFAPLYSLTHGIAVVRGKYDHDDAPGAINHFQALSAALSATVGLGNIGGVAIAISLGGPGAVFWMWVVGFLGMSVKLVEVTQTMLYRNTDDSNEPLGGPMYVADKGLASMSPSLAWLGKTIGFIFCITLMVSVITGGNMFQAWNVGDVTYQNFGVNSIVSGIVLTVVVAAVILGGIKRIGAVAGALVPFMCALYLLASLVVLFVFRDSIFEMLALIVTSAFSGTEASGAFLGGTAGYAFLWGMKRALFSNEAGQGSSPIAHSAARTREPVREGVVAGLEPFIDTIVVCTLTALVILCTGAWNRAPNQIFYDSPQFSQTENGWTLSDTAIREKDFLRGQTIFTIVEADGKKDYIYGEVRENTDSLAVVWQEYKSSSEPQIVADGIFREFVGSSLTSYAFDLAFDGLGKWLVTFSAWLFAISTMISWSYYGEQGMIYMFGHKSVLPYKIVYCALILVATSGIISTTSQLDNLTGFGTGVMLIANIPIMIIFSKKSMDAYHAYKAKYSS